MIAGVAVPPGDNVFADASGAAVIPVGEARGVLREANKVVTAINGETPAKPGRFERCGCWRMRLTQPADRRHSLKRTDTAAASGDLAPRNKTRPKVTSPAGDHDDLIVFGAGSGGYVAAIPCRAPGHDCRGS